MPLILLHSLHTYGTIEYDDDYGPHEAPIRENLTSFSLFMAGGLKAEWNLESLLTPLGWSHYTLMICSGLGYHCHRRYGTLANPPPGRTASEPDEVGILCYKS